ncbi:MAG: chorismate mutase [Coriobacteriia bacterium]|nr:chorismate mutase [Coriobacteriia bacterium]MCL2745531.1 chorismate mutase [Coriobacteriia bacterium]MCL2870843.1 chorismate mutase [Coriobacteriia bacterium]
MLNDGRELEYNADSLQTDVNSQEFTAEQQLDILRQEIDQVDNQIRGLFLQRMKTVQQVAEVKRDAGIPVLHSGREEEVLKRLTSGLTVQQEQEVKALYQKLFEISRKRQS